METTDYVDYQTAVALKECGFDEPCEMFYPDNIKIPCSEISPFPKPRNWNVVEGKTSAVPLWHAQKWLREKWGIHVDACVFSDYSTDADGKVCDRWDFWGFDLYAVVGGEKIIDDDGEYDSYEQALSAGIFAALELIKKGE